VPALDLPVDSHATAQARDLLADLRPRLAGEARFDLWTRTLYATDASLYQVMPLGVVLPRTAEDVHATLALARSHRVPIVARGSGSSLEGQTTGAGLILDFSKYMHKVV
jgi:FAD/FMN-containing dehydrogenase